MVWTNTLVYRCVDPHRDAARTPNQGIWCRRTSRSSGASPTVVEAASWDAMRGGVSGLGSGMRMGISFSMIAPNRLTEVLDEERKDTAAECPETSDYCFVECGITVKRMPVQYRKRLLFNRLP